MTVPSRATPVELPPRISWGRVPTPLDEHPELGASLGVRLALKREDLLDDLGCGHKVRKLGYVTADAVAHGATVLVTVGSLPSSQSVAVAAVAKREGMRAHLVYMGDHQVRPAVAQGNYLLANLLQPTVTWHERTPWAQHEARLEEAAAVERARGGCPYVVPPGIARWPGLAGSIELGYELARQLGPEAAGEVWVVTPAGSGGTCLGISIAARLLGQSWRVAGVLIGGAAAALEEDVAAMRSRAAEVLGRRDVLEAEVVVHEDARGAGYDEPRPEELEAMRDLLGRYGLPVDPNYMVKAFLGLEQLIERGVIPLGERVILVHTGGGMGLFGSAPSLNSWYREQLGEGLANPERTDDDMSP